jgi:hypothetical protein
VTTGSSTSKRDLSHVPLPFLIREHEWKVCFVWSRPINIFFTFPQQFCDDTDVLLQTMVGVQTGH